MYVREYDATAAETLSTRGCQSGRKQGCGAVNRHFAVPTDRLLFRACRYR